MAFWLRKMYLNLIDRGRVAARLPITLTRRKGGSINSREIIPEVSIGRTKLIADQLDLVVVYIASRIPYEIRKISSFFL